MAESIRAHRIRRTRRVVACVILALLAWPAAAGSAAPPLASSGPLPAVAPAAADVVEDETGSTPTQADLEAQQALVAQLQQSARTTSDQLAAAEAQLKAASVLAAAALEAYSSANRAALEADLSESQAREELLRARLDAERARRQLGEWARAAYRGSGTEAGGPSTLLALLQGLPTDEVASAVQLAQAVGQSQTRRVDQLVLVEKEQIAAMERAAAATRRAEAAAARAQAARAARDDAVRSRADVVQGLRNRLETTRADEATAQARADRLAEQVRQAQAALGGADPSCPGGDLSGYENGRLPTSLLCPLWGTSGHLLRPDAAAAFNRLSKAFAGTFGTPICVTDSYRTYAQQVDLYARKPALAAIPGTSNHGWGTAGDLCGGINRFGTPEHEWMVVNAPGYGWFHPAWARSDGSRPEPWHFEFGG